MAYRLIGQDCSITVYSGGAFVAGSTPTFTSLGTVGYAKSIKVDDKVNTVDMHAMGDTRKKLRPTYGEAQLVIDLMIVGVPIAIVMGGYGQVQFSPLAGGTMLTYAGVWVSNALEASADNAQMQNITLDCDYDNV